MARDSRPGRRLHLAPLVGGGLPALFSLALASFGLLDAARANTALQLAFVGAGGLLLAWTGVVAVVARRRGRILALEVVLRKQHYVQALAQGAFLLYWGWHWRPVYDAAFLIAAQLVFAYAFDMLLSWTRRETHTFGFGPFPIVFSINLFLWFADDWFALQFLLVAIGLAAKALIRWEKDGRQVHIFNPSSFPLALFSLALILTGTSDLTWGQEIATTQNYPPHVYLVLFLIALPGQLLFGVTSMTMAAVAVTYLFGLLYHAATGIYFFYDSYIPIAVFLGMHLLFTDPSTAPRTEVGRLLFGALYGLSTIALYALLVGAGVPPYYDKLLQVPLLNLSIQWLDRVAQSIRLPVVAPAGGGGAGPRRRLVSIAVWAGLFTIMSASEGVGDRHPGQWVPFWDAACAEGRPHACPYLLNMQLRFCGSGSGWACNEAGLLQVAPTGPEGPPPVVDPAGAAEAFARGCDLGFEPACRNRTSLATGRPPSARADPTLADYPIVLRGTKGPIAQTSPADLYARACSQGWIAACGRRGDDPAR